jgi:hypothetical protein
MTDTDRIQDWRVLCELASKEKDPKKLLDLVTKINQAIEESRQKQHDPVDAPMFSSSRASHPRSLPESN